MQRLPNKLFEMTQQGVPESAVQHIFDALIHAEENGFRFVNVYQGEETAFRFTNNRKEAHQQLSMWLRRSGLPGIGFVHTGETWDERK
jgi:hypothetical protein